MDTPKPTKRICHPFSDTVVSASCFTCCNNMNMVQSLNFPFQCQTCACINDDPEAPIQVLFSAGDCKLNDHFNDYHVIICTICYRHIFHGPFAKQRAFLHLTQCVIWATANISRPYFCCNCCKVIWMIQ